jgi:hypothetical protein
MAARPVLTAEIAGFRHRKRPYKSGLRRSRAGCRVLYALLYTRRPLYAIHMLSQRQVGGTRQDRILASNSAHVRSTAVDTNDIQCMHIIQGTAAGAGMADRQTAKKSVLASVSREPRRREAADERCTRCLTASRWSFRYLSRQPLYGDAADFQSARWADF